jgi:hypothetical protein
MNTTQDDDRTISIDCEEFRDCLKMKLRELAAERCRRMLLDRMKREGTLGDKGYTVS